MKTVKITAVELNKSLTSKAGKPYVANVLTYVDGEGNEKKTNIMPTNPVVAELPNLKVGQHVGLKFAKDGEFFKLVGFELNPEAAPQILNKASQKSSSFVAKDFNSDGMQVGNALNNAAVILAHGKHEVTVDMLEKTAFEIMKASERLKLKLKELRAAPPFPGAATPEHVAATEQPAPSKPILTEVSDDEMIF